ncbi:hypothetical protein DV736_g3659, partial [Chaetothyriales sp. CBS 134916]
MPPRIQPLSSHLCLRPRRFIISSFSTTPQRLSSSSPQQQPHNIHAGDANDPSTPPRPSFYRTHGRAFFKCFTLAFFTYQLVYYGWLTLETEYTRDEIEREIQAVEAEVRLLDDGRRAHRVDGSSSSSGSGG